MRMCADWPRRNRERAQQAGRGKGGGKSKNPQDFPTAFPHSVSQVRQEAFSIGAGV